MKLKPIGFAFQKPSSRPEVFPEPKVIAPFSHNTTPLEGIVLNAVGAVIQVAVKFPALKPELIVALVPGQTPLAVVVTVAVGKGYTPTEIKATEGQPPLFGVPVTLKSVVAEIVAVVEDPDVVLKVVPLVNDSQVYTTPVIEELAVNVTSPPVPQKLGTEGVIVIISLLNPSSVYETPAWFLFNELESVAVTDQVTVALDGVTVGIIPVQSLPAVLVIVIGVWAVPLIL